ncbi:YqcI/YcgG family protein [Alkalihalobacterium alkalinitrilicum]|uniref:YqcI/YcgG family protein n=1 Tax=Alkalihalobacterium alkalinitrilicum TaxID=427920 RepID=UPI0009957BD9
MIWRTYKFVAQILKEYSINSRQFGKCSTLVIFLKTSSSDNLKVEHYEKIHWKLINQLTEHDEKEWPIHIPKDPQQNVLSLMLIR